MIKNKYAIGTVLCTKNSQNFGNAIITAADETTVTVLSDFGNIMVFAHENLHQNFTLSTAWAELATMGFPYPTVKERIEQQICLLNEALKNL